MKSFKFGFFVAFCTALSGSACEASDESAPVTTFDDDDPLYLVQTRVFTPDTTTGYVTPTSSLSRDLEYSQSIEQAGGGVLYAESGIGAFMIGSGERPEITRYEIEGNQLTPGAVLSFANEGVVYLYAGSVIFVNARKAYYIDLDQLQAISFDPTRMRILDTISLAGAEREGYFTSFGEVVRREDGIYFPGQWYTEPDWDRVPSGSMLIRIDPETDEVTYTSDARCTSLFTSLTADNGDIYWFSDFFNTLARVGHGDDHGVPDCALRLKEGEQRFDPEWQLDTASFTDGAPAIASLRAEGSKMWFRVLDQAALDEQNITFPAAYSTLESAPVWQWQLLDLDSGEPAVRNDERPLSGVGAMGMYVDGRSFVTIEEPDLSETTLLELTEDGFIERGSAPGVIDEIARVR
jgi:hypothetical protein